MKQDVIAVRGARVNNLKNVNIDIPKNKLVIMTGLSGSGKTSLALQKDREDIWNLCLLMQDSS